MAGSPVQYLRRSFAGPQPKNKPQPPKTTNAAIRLLEPFSNNKARPLLAMPAGYSLQGICSTQNVTTTIEACNMATRTLLEEMRASIGMREIPGSDSNPEIVAYFADCGWKLSELGEDSTVAWCAARMGSALKRCGYPIPPKNVNLSARSYATYGIACDPQPGAIGVVPRGTSGWQGHVFVIEEVLPDGRWQTIGGNQGALGEVSRVIIDPRKVQVLGVRQPVEASVPALRAAGSAEIKNADKLEISSWLGLLASSATAAVQQLLAAVKLPDLSDLPAALDWYGLVIRSASSLGKLVLEAPYLSGAALTCLVCIMVARQWRAARLEKHSAGVPLSSQVEKTRSSPTTGFSEVPA